MFQYHGSSWLTGDTKNPKKALLALETAAIGFAGENAKFLYGSAARALSWAKGFSLTDAHNELIRE